MVADGYEKPARQVFTPSAVRAFKLPTVGFNLDCWTHGLDSKANQGKGKHHRWPSLVTAKLPEEVDGYQRCATSIPR
jgi:hypothetical protein